MKWIIVFYQVIVGLPEGKIIFSGLDAGSKFIKTDKVLLDYYKTQENCERNLKKFQGNNKVIEVDSFYSKRVTLVTDKAPLINQKRMIVNAFQCLGIK